MSGTVETVEIAKQGADQVSHVFRSLIEALVDEPKGLKFETELVADESTLQVWGTEREMGRSIGANGRNARSMRTLMAAAAHKLRSALNIVEKAVTA